MIHRVGLARWRPHLQGIRCFGHVRLYPIRHGLSRLFPEGKWRGIESSAHQQRTHPAVADSAAGQRALVPDGSGSSEKVKVLASCLHGVDHELVATVEAKDHDLQKAATPVEAEEQLACWTDLAQVADEECVFSGIDSVIRINSVFARGAVDLQATYTRMAARIASERLTWSRSARSTSAARRVSSMRTGTTFPGPSPAGFRPRLRSRSTS